MTQRIHARAGRLAVALLISIAVAASATAAANASPRTGGAGPSLGAGPSFKLRALSLTKTTNTPFQVSYDAEGYYGAVKCTGHHQANEKKGFPGDETEGGRDLEKCVSTTGKPLVGLAPNETVALGAGWFPGSSGWNSDYDGQAATSIQYTVSSNAKSFKLVAYYPFAG